MNPLRRVLLKMMGSGRLPEDLRATLSAEGLVFLEEGLSGSITYRNYRAPGRRSSFRKEMIAGAVAVSGQRLVVCVGSAKHIDVPHAHPLRAAVEVTAEESERVCFAYTAQTFRNDRSGEVEVRLHTSRAEELVGLLTEDGRF